MLKNERSTCRWRRRLAGLAVIGPLADSAVDQMGAWTVDGRASGGPDAAGGACASGWAGRAWPWALGLEVQPRPEPRRVRRGGRGARGADAAVLFLGEGADSVGRGPFARLPEPAGRAGSAGRRSRQTGKPMVVVIMAGRRLTSMSLGGCEKAAAARAVRLASRGRWGGPAIADVLLATRTPQASSPSRFRARSAGSDLLRAP